MAAKAKPSVGRQIIDILTQTNKTIVTAESCTGGLIAAALTDIPGASAALYGGYVTYSNAAKSRMIHVQPRLIHDYGAVSNQVARAINQPSAARAVGSAIGANPVAVLIPCHRVIQQSGALGGYRWGDVRKHALHAWETARYSPD